MGPHQTESSTECTKIKFTIRRKQSSVMSNHSTRYKIQEERWLYFFCDVPHLIKTTRNCWSHSFGHGQTRQLWVSSWIYTVLHYCNINSYSQFNGEHISWQHLMELYRRNQGTSDRAGLVVLTKLKLEHVKLNSYSRMRVDLAAQVCVLVNHSSTGYS